VEALVGLEPVAAVPVAALLDEYLGLVNVGLDYAVVAVEEANPDLSQAEVDL
jgi:hypothetical protein